MVKLSCFKRSLLATVLTQLLPGSSMAAGSGKACSAWRQWLQYIYIYALNMHVCNIYTLNMDVCNIYRCTKIYIFILAYGLFLVLSWNPGSCWPMVGTRYHFGGWKVYLDIELCTTGRAVGLRGEELVIPLTRGSLVEGNQPWVVLFLLSVVSRALIGMFAATGAAQNQYCVKIFSSSSCNCIHTWFVACLSVSWTRVASCWLQ